MAAASRIAGALALLLAAAVVGLLVVYSELSQEREHSRALAGQLAALSDQRDAFAKQAQSLGSELATASTRLADLRRKGLKIYTCELDLAFSGVTLSDRRLANLAALVTLSTADQSKSYDFTNPDLTATLEADRLRLLFEPVDPTALIGRDISTLAGIAALRMNLAPLLKLAHIQLADTSAMSYELRINSVPVVRGLSANANLAQTGQVSVPVANLFVSIERTYALAIGLPPAGEGQQ